MNSDEKIFILIGTVFAIVGIIVSTVFIAVGFEVDGAFLAFSLIPLFFVVLGACFIIAPFRKKAKREEIRKKGKRYPSKIYGYATNASFVINGVHPKDTKVHFFDEMNIEREVIIPTHCAGSDGLLPIGMTIDVFEYKGKYAWDETTLRNEILPRESELMDNKPIDPSKINVIAVKCQNCGASYEAVQGYTGQCPYCGGYTNA